LIDDKDIDGLHGGAKMSSGVRGTPDFLMDEKVVSEDQQLQVDDSLAQLKGLADLYLDYESRIEELEQKLKELKKVYNDLGQSKIPELLLSTGMKMIALDDGRKISTKEDISVTVKDEFLLYRFLVERGHEDIVKTQVTLGRLEDEDLTKILDAISDVGADFETERKVNAQTLKKYFRSMLGIDAELDRAPEIDESIYKEFASVYRYYKTKVENTKKKAAKERF
jgi:hypothetical protein